MTGAEIIPMLRNILPHGWRVELANTCHVEVWCYHPRADELDEWAIAVSHSGAWSKSTSPSEWSSELSMWWDGGEYEEECWVDTPEEAIEFVRVNLHRLIAASKEGSA